MLKGSVAPAVEDKPYTDRWGSTLSGYAPILDSEGRSVGLVGVDVHVAQIAALRRHVLAVVASAFGGAFVLLILASILVARSVRKPLTRLIEGTEAIARGELTTRLRMQRGDEFGVVARHFDSMAEALQDRCSSGAHPRSGGEQILRQDDEGAAVFDAPGVVIYPESAAVAAVAGRGLVARSRLERVKAARAL